MKLWQKYCKISKRKNWLFWPKNFISMNFKLINSSFDWSQQEESNEKKKSRKSWKMKKLWSKMCFCHLGSRAKNLRGHNSRTGAYWQKSPGGFLSLDHPYRFLYKVEKVQKKVCQRTPRGRWFLGTTRVNTLTFRSARAHRPNQQGSWSSEKSAE